MAALRNTFVILIFARGFHKSSGKSIKLYMLLCKRSSSITYRVLREWIVLQLLWPTLLTGSSIKCFYANSHIVTHQFLKKSNPVKNLGKIENEKKYHTQFQMKIKQGPIFMNIISVQFIEAYTFQFRSKLCLIVLGVHKYE